MKTGSSMVETFEDEARKLFEDSDDAGRVQSHQ